MTVDSVDPTITLNAAGTGPYAFPFKIYTDCDLAVDLINPLGPLSRLVLNVDYTVVGAGDEGGGYITTTQSYSSPIQICLSLEMDITQTVDLVEDSGLSAESVELGLDRLARIIQQESSKITRSIKFTPAAFGGGSVDINSTPAERAFKYLQFSSDGLALNLVEMLTASTLQTAVRVDNVEDLLAMTPSASLAAVLLLGYRTPGDGGGHGLHIGMYGAAPGTYVHNGGSVKVPTGGNGSCAWVWCDNGGSHVVEWGADKDGIEDSSPAFAAAFAAERVVYSISSGSTFLLKSKVNIPGDRTLINYGSTITGHADNAGYIFESAGTVGTPKTHITYLGGTIKLMGALGGINFNRGCYFCAIRDLRIDDAATLSENTCFVNMINGFHLHMSNCLFGSMAASGVAVNLETDEGDGFEELNNVSIDGSTFSSLYGNTHLRLYNRGVGLDNITVLNCSFQGGGNQVIMDTDTAHIWGVSVKDVHFETNGLTGIVGITANALSSGNIQFRMDNSSFANGHGSTNYDCFALNGDTSSTVTLSDMHYTAHIDATGDVFLNNDFAITQITPPNYSGFGIEPEAGSGVLLNHYRKFINKTAGDTVKLAWENGIVTNTGATGIITLGLKPATGSGRRHEFLVTEDTKNITIDPNGTDRILILTNTDGDRITSNTVGSRVILEDVAAGKWGAMSFGTWADIS